MGQRAVKIICLTLWWLKYRLFESTYLGIWDPGEGFIYYETANTVIAFFTRYELDEQNVALLQCTLKCTSFIYKNLTCEVYLPFQRSK